MSDSGLDRRRFLAVSTLNVAVASMGLSFAESTSSLAASTEKANHWHNVRTWGVEGKGWADTARDFDRLPRKAEALVRSPVWNLSRHSAGLLTRFETDATAIHVRYSLLSGHLAMSHMPATGVSGLDLYAQDEAGHDRWLAVARPTAQQIELCLASGIDAPVSRSTRRYTLYLPLYNGVESLEIGVDPKSTFHPISPRTDKPMVFYGTSIMQGACASRPGMAFAAILGRRMNRPVINLGFSGNGTMEAEVGALLTELDPSVYIIDCLPNMMAESVAQRTEPLVRQLRAARPETPILLVEDRTYGYARFKKAARDRHAASRLALRKAFDKLIASGMDELHYLEGADLLGDDGEATTDGSHPNDLGMVRYAEVYEQILSRIIKS